jgi:hypothetical protein
MDVPAVTALVTAASSAVDVVKSLHELKSAAEIHAKVSALQGEILAVQSAALAMQRDYAVIIDENRRLKTELELTQGWDTERVRYGLCQVATGVFAYALRKSMSNGDPAHWLCTSCFDAGRKTFLVPKPGGFTFSLHCHVCGTNIRTDSITVPIPTYAQL